MKSLKQSHRKLNLNMNIVRKLADAQLSDVNGGDPIKASEGRFCPGNSQFFACR